MVLRKLKVDSVTRSRLGKSTLADVRARLWAIDCQTCGLPLHGDTPSLVVDCDGDLALAMLHHRQCRAPGWFDGPVSYALPTLTWRSATFLWMPPGMPVFMVNPSCEATVLRWTDVGWLAADLDGFRASGLADDIAHARANRVEGLVATIDRQRLTVDFAVGDKQFSWSSAVNPAVAAAIDSLAAVLVAVTNRLDPSTGITPDQFMALIQQDAVVGLASVRFTPEVQWLRPGDFDREARIEIFASYAEAVDHALEIKVDEPHLRAAFAACDGDSGPVESLSGRDRILALLMVAGLYATLSHTKDEAPLAGEGAHVLVPDEDAVERFSALFQPVCNALGVSVGLLPGSGYHADIVIGTPERFAAARSWSPVHRGRLAITVDVDEMPLGPYRRALAVGPVPQAARVAEAVNWDVVVERLLKERIILLHTEINDAAADRLAAQMLLLEAEDPTADITFYINSPGGSVTAAMAILNTMKHVKPDVATWAMGLAAGTAQLLLAAGAPGKRYALPHARVILTFPKGPSDPTPAQHEALIKWTREVTELTAANTGQSVEQVRADAERDRAFLAAEAVEYGLVDRIERPSPGHS